MLMWAQCALASARLAAGDVAGALELAGDAAPVDASPDLHTAGQPGWCLGMAVAAAGNPGRGIERMLHAFGGPDLTALLPADRAAAALDLVEAHLAAGDLAAAQDALARAETSVRTAHARSVIAIARAAVLLARDRPGEAAAAASAAARAAPLTRARARLVEGQALAAAGERDLA